jgi:hypothetical protein
MVTLRIALVLGLLAPAVAHAGKPAPAAALASLKQRATKVVKATGKFARDVRNALADREADDNHLNNQGFGKAGSVLRNIRAVRKDTVGQRVLAGRTATRVSHFGWVTEESRADHEGGQHVAVERLEVRSPDGVSEREYVRSITRGGPGGKITRAVAVHSLNIGGQTHHRVSDERVIGKLFRMERQGELVTRNGVARNSTSRTYVKIGSQIRIPWITGHMEMQELEDHARQAAAPIAKTTHGEQLTNAAGETAPVNIALGLRSTAGRGSIDEFGEQVGGVSYHGWHNYGFLQHHAEAKGTWNDNLRTALHAAIDKGGRIKFDVTELASHNRITSDELRLIRWTPKFLSHTDFYEHTAGEGYRKLSPAEVSQVWERIHGASH